MRAGRHFHAHTVFGGNVHAVRKISLRPLAGVLARRSFGALHNLPLAQKLIWLMMASNGVGLLVAGCLTLNHENLSWWQNLISVLTMTLASLAAAFLMALWLKHFVSRPILDLVRVAKTVSRERTSPFAPIHVPGATSDCW